MTTKRHRQDDPCACLAWKDVYSTGKAWCGAGRELLSYDTDYYSLSQDYMRMYNENEGGSYSLVCQNFFEKLPGNMCLNAAWGVEPRQWCYVSSECYAGKNTSSDKVHAKWCNTAGNDELMNTKTPEQINDIATENGLMLTQLAKFAYSSSPLSWADVESASKVPKEMVPEFHVILNASGEKHQSVNATEEARASLEDVIASGVTTIFDEKNMMSPGTIVMGNKIYASMPEDVAKDSSSSSLSYVCKIGCDS
jgi:hypothetical protein